MDSHPCRLFHTGFQSMDHLHVVVPITVVFTALAALIFIRDVVLWRKALLRDLSTLMKDRDLRHPPARKALGLVEARCRDLLASRISADNPAPGISSFLESIAGCFHPGSIEPLLEVTPARIIRGLETSMARYDRLLSRPGFSRVARLSLGDVLLAASVSKKHSAGRKNVFRALFTALKNARAFFLLKFLAADAFLYLGCLAVDIYDEKVPGMPPGNSEDLESTLRELSGLELGNTSFFPEEIQRIRNSLVGLPGILVNEPTPGALKEALLKAAGVIAGGYFPQSGHPLLEARIGPLSTRGRIFLKTIGNSGDYPANGRILSIRLSTLLKTRSLGQVVIPKPLRDLAEKALNTHGWLKWPLRVYMMTGKGVFWKFAADAGWFAGRKALLVLFFGRCFDRAVQEIDQVYRLSR